MNAFNWSTEIYYRSKAESALLKIFRGLTALRDLGKETLTLKTVYDVLTKKGYVRELAIELRDLGGKSASALEEIAALLDRPSEAKDLQGLITNLEKVIYSGAGELLTEDAGENSFTVEEAIENGLITYFLMNSLSSKETATTVGKLLLQDLMGYVGRAYEKEAGERKLITIIIDEFAEFAIPEFPSFLNRVRGAGINVVIAHQTRSDLKAVSPDYQNKIEANTNTKIVAGVTDPEDAQFYAQMIGTRATLKKTYQVQEEGVFFVTETSTGMKSVREVEEFIIHPNRIKRIEQGEALVISRTVDTRFGLVAVPRAREFGAGISRREVEDQLKVTRRKYLIDQAPGLKTEFMKNSHVSKSEKQQEWN
jgi:type IV secretory pathway TraG/TraD family ATPase VirD4